MKCYKSRWILTAEDEILENMAIVVDEGKFVDIIPNDSVNFEEKYVKDLGNAVVTPGFVDMLTQFQYTDIDSYKPKTFKNKIKKIFSTIYLKNTFAGVRPTVYSHKWAKILAKYFVMDREDKIKSFDSGVESAIAAGTTCVAQVSKEVKFFDTINKMPIKNYLFFEIFADSSQKSKKQFKEIRAKVEDLIMHKGENTHIGIMLNSISGAHKKLWELFSKYCRKHNMLLLTRFVESEDELEWLEHGFSDIDLLHKFMHLRKITPYERGISPVEYLGNLRVFGKQVIVANASCLRDDDLEKLSESGVNFVYQPYYGDEICNKKLSFDKVLKYFPKRFGFSAQSFCNDKDFSMLKLAINSNKNVGIPLDELIKYITIYPAKILRLDNHTGSIKVGKDADFNVFKLDNGETWQDLVNHTTPYSTYSKGRKVVKRGDIRFDL